MKKILSLILASLLACGLHGQVANTGHAADAGSVAADSGGDIVGPASSTNNAFARFSGTTGKLLQDTPDLTYSSPTMSVPDGFVVSSAGSIGLTAGGSNKSVTLTPSGTGVTRLVGQSTIGPASFTANIGSANTSTTEKSAFINLNTTTFPSLPRITTTDYGTGLIIAGTDAVGANLYLTSYGNNSVFRTDSFGGTAASPSAVTSGMQLGGTQARGYDGTSLGLAAGVVVYAVEDFTTGAHGANFTVRTTAKTTTSFATKLTLTDAGNLLLGSNATTTGAGNSNGVIQLASTSATDGLAIGTRAAEVIYRTGNDALRTDSSWTVAGNLIPNNGVIIGGAGNMTITAGTGASRTLTLQTTTSGSTATNAVVFDASQNAAFTGNITQSASKTINGNLRLDNSANLATLQNTLSSTLGFDFRNNGNNSHLLVNSSGLTFGAANTTTAITGAAGNMTITAGTGASRTLTLQTTTAGGTATNALVIGAAQTVTSYANVATAGAGLVAVRAAGRVTAQSAANASISTFTVGAADGSFEVSANMNVTASTALATTLTCTYTDESNTARTMIFPVAQLAGTFITAGAITGTGAWETPTLHIRCKAATAITILTSAGTFTGVTYTAEGIIKQTN